MFTTSIFKRSIWNQADAWQPLGYIPIDQNFYSGEQWNAMSSEIKSVRLNILFDVVLQSFREAQRDNALRIPLTLGEQTKIVNQKVPLAFIIGDIQGGDGICGRSVYYQTKVVSLKVPLAFIIGDIQGGDGICGRSAFYQTNARHICRMCNATPKVYDSKEVENCKLLVMEEMKQLCINNNTKKLHSLM